MNDSKQILLLKKGDQSILKKLYIEYRADFIAFGRKISVLEDDVLDSYQDAIIALQEQAFKGKLDNITCSLKTYLFGIGKYILYEKNRKQQKTVLKVVETNDYETIEIDVFSNTLSNQQQKIQTGFNKLGKKCKEILQLFYYRGYTIEDITDYLNYENKNVVKSQKSRCLKQLKEIIKEL